MTPGLFGPIDGRALPAVQLRGYRICMKVGGREYYVTTQHGTEKAARAYAKRLQVHTGKKHIVRMVGGAE